MRDSGRGEGFHKIILGIVKKSKMFTLFSGVVVNLTIHCNQGILRQAEVHFEHIEYIVKEKPSFRIKERTIFLGYKNRCKKMR